MSWSASYPVPTRRSRSRSPPRPPYPSRAPYPDGGYPPESYRGGHYEAADRERPHGYERERPPNDYGRRGRSRSPGPDDCTSSSHLTTTSVNLDQAVSRKRRRSLSPYERDRYDPRPRYNDDYGLIFLIAFRHVCSSDPDSRRPLSWLWLLTATPARSTGPSYLRLSGFTETIR